MAYDATRNNYEEALWSKDCMGHTYALETKAAVTRFLYGFTEFSHREGYGYVNGWVKTFSRCTEATVCNMLVKPVGDNYRPSFIGYGKLWA